MTLILSLDDETALLHLFGMILEYAGYDFLGTRDNDEALALLRSRPVDLFTQDVMRPDMDGMTFYRVMKADERLCHIPVLFITAGCRPAFAEECRLRYGDRYLQKPCPPQALIAAVGEILTCHGKPVPTEEQRAARYEKVRAKYFPQFKSDAQFDQVWQRVGQWLLRT